MAAREAQSPKAAGVRERGYGSDGDDRGLQSLSEPVGRRAVISNIAGKNSNRLSGILDIWDGRKDLSKTTKLKKAALLQ